jgi:FkbM family methyltransferase
MSTSDNTLEVRREEAAFTVRRTSDGFWESVQQDGWEWATFCALRDHMIPGALYLDVGAWIGPTVLYAATYAERLVALEPDQAAMAALRANLALNPAIEARVELLPAALTAEDGEVVLHTLDAGNSMSSVLNWRGPAAFTVPALSPATLLDRVLRSEQAIYVKMDVEGAEFSMLPALCDELDRRGLDATLLIALHGHLFTDGRETNAARHDALFARLSEFGTIWSWQGDRWSPLADVRDDRRVAAELETSGGFSDNLMIKRRR